MNCPKCDAFLMEKDFVRSNVVVAAGIEMEYLASCPNCGYRLGRVFWGKLEATGGSSIGKKAILDKHNLRMEYLKSKKQDPKKKK